VNKQLAGRYGAIALGVVMVGGVAGMARKQAPKPPTQKTETVGTPVEVQAACLGDVARWTQVTGSLISQQDVALSSRMAGRLAQVLVREGDPVAVGQVIARLDTVDLEARVRAEEGAVASAQARVAQAEAAYRQQVVSSATGVDSAEAAYRQQQVNTSATIDAAQAAYQQQLIQSRANIEAAEAGLQSAKAALSQVREGARKQEISQAENQVAIAKANRNKAASDYRRYKTLLEEGAIAEVTADQYRTTYDVAQQQLQAAEQALSLVREGARSQEVIQAEQNVRQAEEKLRQAKAAAAQDDVRRADLQSARAGRAQNEVRLAALKSARAARAQDAVRQAEVQAARASLQQAHSALAIAQKNLLDASIVSPVAGQVASRTADPGQIVAAGAPILRVVSLDSVYFEPSVPDKELGRIKVGQKVEIKIDAFPKRTFTGSITRIYPAGSAKNRSFPVRIAVANPERLLRPQMYARGRIETESRSKVVLIPRDALLKSDQGAGSDTSGRIFIVENGTAQERSVTLGLSAQEGGKIEARGVPADAQVVIAGHRSLATGDKVAAKQAGDATTASLNN
jgi:RND family efflux transporter MFP subunit